MEQQQQSLISDSQSATLSQLDLPVPSALSEEQRASANRAHLQRLNSDIAKLELSDPSAIHHAASQRQQDRVAGSLIDTLATMDLPNPERLSLDDSNKDKQKKKPLQQSEALASVPAVAVPAPTTTQTDAALLSEPVAPSEAEKVGEQKVTPWDVEGAVVDGVQVGFSCCYILLSLWMSH